tara:strand:+ start:2929 stop:3456 length:528 start_codon:yes stop_codon:yes gene_type:complete
MKSIYKDWHKMFPGSGQGKQFEWMMNLVYRLKPRTVLDWGCGKGGTAAYIESEIPNLNITRYDPGTEQYNTPPKGTFEFVYSTDVFEHIEAEDIDSSIQQVQSYTTNFHAHIIDLDPAKKRLPDGRNAHVTLWTAEEWVSKFDTQSEVLDYHVEAYPDKYLEKGRHRIHLLCLKR